ncbi:MAG: ABC transporter permease [Saprospiraceae bacterium]
MFKNYFTLAWRNLVKRKGYSLINVAGLATGLAICMLIVLFIRNEMSYDNFIEGRENIFRLVVNRKYPGRSTSYSMIPQSYAAAVKAEFPEVKEVVRLYDFLGGGVAQYRYEDKRFEEKNVLFTDSTFFSVFNYPFIAGDPKTALDQPNSIVITATTAKKYFGSTDNAVGKMLKQEGNTNDPLKITGVCRDWPENSHFEFNILITTAGNRQFRAENFVNFGPHTYLLLNAAASDKKLEAKFPEVIKKYAAGNIAQAFAMPYEEFTKAGNGYLYYLQPLSKIHLTSHLEGELKPNGSIQAVYIFGAIAIIILLLAIINFVNLSTARSGERAREVGIRKTFGSEKNALIFQFLTESMIISFAGLIFALGLVYFLLPYFNQFASGDLKFNQVLVPANLILFIVLTAITGLLAGLYPAFVLSAFKPIAVLKGKFINTGYGVALRNGLVVFQFSISIVLIICTLIVNQQMNYMTGNSLGYNKDQTIIINRTDVLAGHSKTFKEELRALPGVTKVSNGSAYPGDDNYFGISWRVPGATEPMTGRGIMADDQYQATFNLELKQGRFFSKEYGTDSLALVLNEAAVKELGLKDPLGANLVTPEDFLNGPNQQQYLYHVVGVVKDYNYQSLHLPITPLVFTNTSRFNDVTFSGAVRLKPGNIPETIKAVETTWNKFVKDHPFTFEFLDQTIARQYIAEVRTQKVFTFFSGLAIFIACIGLFGLAAYTCQQRMKEISVRKVLGASSTRIVTLLSKNFIRLVLIASMISFPVAWYLMHRWLQDFSYRITVGWWNFALAGLLSLGIALITLSFQTIRAGLGNPITALRSE